MTDSPIHSLKSAQEFFLCNPADKDEDLKLICQSFATGDIFHVWMFVVTASNWSLAHLIQLYEGVWSAVTTLVLGAVGNATPDPISIQVSHQQLVVERAILTSPDPITQETEKQGPTF